MADQKNEETSPPGPEKPEEEHDPVREMTDRMVAMIRGLDREDPFVEYVMRENMDAIVEGREPEPESLDSDDLFRPTREHEPSYRAQTLIYDAWEYDDTKMRASLARQALQIYPDCADAYSVLADDATTPQRALKLYLKALTAAEREMPAEALTRMAGLFWGIVETRPYMRARLGLAQCLWELGREDQAVAHYEALLKLDREDRLGVRYLLAHSFLMMDENERLGKLLAQHENDIMPSWLYIRVLHLLRLGDLDRAAEVLALAMSANGFVPDYLLGLKPIPEAVPDSFTYSSDEEAIAYAADYAEAWEITPGALRWLGGQTGKKARRPRR